MTVVGAVDGQGMVQSPGSSSSAKEKKSSSSDKKTASKPSTSSEKPVKLPTTHRSSADARIDELDQKWSVKFNRLEAILLAKTMDKEPTFCTVKGTPTATAPAGIAKSTEPFIRPAADQTSDLAGGHYSPHSQATDKSRSSSSDSKHPSSDLHGVSQTAPRAQSTSKSHREKSTTDQRSYLPGTDPPSSQQVTSRSSPTPAGLQSPPAMDTDSDSDFSDQPPVDIFVEEGELSDQDPDATPTDPDQTLSEDQNYRETMRGIRSYMGWSHIPDMDATATASDDNPFAGPQSQPAGKVQLKCQPMSGCARR